MKQTRIYPLAGSRRARGQRVHQPRRDGRSTPCTATTSPSSRRSTSSSRRSRPRRSTPSGPGSSPRSASSTGSRSRPTTGCAASSRRPRRSAPVWPAPSPTPRRDPDAALYGSWKNAFVGGSYEFLRDGARLLDARTQFHYLATVITPAMAHAQVGAGRPTPTRVHDSNGDLLDGGRDLPAARRRRTRRRRTSGPSTSTTPRPGRCSRCRRRSGRRWPATPARCRPTTTAPTTSISVPPRPQGKESNWVETIPGKSWFQLFRLYGPLEPWFDQTWKLNEFEPID